MPVLRSDSDLQRLELPSTANKEDVDRAWVVMDVSTPTGRDLLSVDANETSGQTTVRGLAARIKEWNYTDENGTTMPINYNTVQLLEVEDIKFLNAQIKDASEDNLTTEEKKTSSDTSTESKTIEVQDQA